MRLLSKLLRILSLITYIHGSWATMCAANNETNGVDNKGQQDSGRIRKDAFGRRLARSAIKQSKASNGIGLPSPFLPTLPTVSGSEGVIKNYILPDNKTGVVRLTGGIYFYHDSSDLLFNILDVHRFFRA